MMIQKTYLLKYRRHVLATLFACGGILTQSCSDRVDDVDFNVSVPQEIYAGEPMTFSFDGNPDYIVFYSGTTGNQYANRNRTNIGIDQMDISYSITQRYTTRQDFKEPILHVMVSEDFTGEQSAAAIQAATWTELSAQTGSTTAEKPFPVPNPDAIEQNPTGYANAINVDFSSYKDKQFFFAFKYLAGLHPTISGGSGANATYANHPRIDITEMNMQKVAAGSGETIVMDDLQNEWGFSTIFVNSTTQATYTISSNTLMFQPQGDHRDQPVEVWMISQRLDPTSVEPDRGTALKGTNIALSSYQYTYTEPGTYTATFIATNANMWDSKQTVREVTFEVKDRNSTGEGGGEAEGGNEAAESGN